MSDAAPKDAPPSYAMATGSSTTSNSNNLQVPGAQNGIPAASRRSMEDEHRPLPEGWVRQWDTNEQHQFFVDTKTSPPRSTWHHPYDDEEYLSTLTSEQREQLQEDERLRRLHDHSDDESAKAPGSKASAAAAGISSQHTGASSFDQELPPRPSGSASHSTGKKSLGERLKQSVTGQTKEERAAYKRQREEEERQYYEAHMRFRDCLQRAQMTGQPQFFAKDKDGREIYIEPPNRMGYPGGYANGYGYNPYTSGPYANPNARFVRPAYPYNRPYGSGYGGGYGMPVAGGLLGGLLLGGLLF